LDSGGPEEAQIPSYSPGGALVNTILPPVCGGDTALRQITLTTCLSDYTDNENMINSSIYSWSSNVYILTTLQLA